jgi:hypothetical protein
LEAEEKLFLSDKKKNGISFKIGDYSNVMKITVDKPEFLCKLNVSVLDSDKSKIVILSSINNSKGRIEGSIEKSRAKIERSIENPKVDLGLIKKKSFLFNKKKNMNNGFSFQVDGNLFIKKLLIDKTKLLFEFNIHDLDVNKNKIGNLL